MKRAVTLPRAAMGCGALLAVALCMAGALALVARARLAALTEDLQAQLERDYAALEEAGRIPPEDAELARALYDCGRRPEANYLAAAGVLAALGSVFDDARAEPEERAMLQALRALLDERPAPRERQMIRFAEEHPRIRDAFTAYTPANK
jgi:hypothetical protein